MRHPKSQWEKRVKRSLQERWRGLQGEGEEDRGEVQREGGEGEGEGEREEEEEGGTGRGRQPTFMDQSDQDEG